MPSQPVLVIIEVDTVHDAQAFTQYQAAAREQILARGARVIARGGSTIEGEPPLGSLVIQQWPSEAAFREWQSSAEYAPYKRLRQQAAKMRMCIVPGT